MSQKVLITYGDGPGRTVISAAEKVLGAVAPDLELIHAKIGAEAYESTGYALPPATMEALSECDVMLSGSVNVEGLPERNPLDAIKKQLGLGIEYTEFFPLCDYLGEGEIDAVVLSPAPESTMVVYETETPEGISSEYFTGSDSLASMFSRTIRLVDERDGKTIHLVSDGILFPKREELIKTVIGKYFADTQFRVVGTELSEIMYMLAHDHKSAQILFCDIPSAAAVHGLGSGIVGGSGLMPSAFIGNDISLYTTSRIFEGDSVGREFNPTSAILSVAVMLLDMGREEDYRNIRGAVCEMYRSGRTTPDIGGKLSAEKFAQGVNELVHSMMKA